jgi:hypothetical protein
VLDERDGVPGEHADRGAHQQAEQEWAEAVHGHVRANSPKSIVPGSARGGV